jgi:hypothetical protein
VVEDGHFGGTRHRIADQGRLSRLGV